MEWLWWFWFCLESIVLKMAMSFIKKYIGRYIQQEDLTQNICSPLNIEFLKKMVAKSTDEVWTFTEMNNQVYSAPIIIEDGYLLLKSLSKRHPPASSVKIQYQEVKKIINRNNVTTFLEINPTQVDDSLEKVFIHIQLQGGEGRIKLFELMCSGEENGISYAKTSFLETFGNGAPGAYPDRYPYALLGGMRNDGCDDVLQELTVGNKIIKTITPGLVASRYQFKEDDYLEEDGVFTTHFIIYTKGDSDSEEKCCIGKVVYGLNAIENLYIQARIHEAKSIDIDDCGIVLARSETLSSYNSITIEYVKELVIQSTSGVWAILNKKGQIYCAQVVLDNGYLLLKSLSKRAPPTNATTIPYHKVKSLIDRDNITIFLEIKPCEEDDSNFGKKLIHIKLNGNEGRHLQFEVMCTGEVDGISYAKTVYFEPEGLGLCGGARNDGLETELPGFTLGKKDDPGKYIAFGLVCSFWDCDFPTKFIIFTPEEKKYSKVDYTLGNVVFGMEDALLAQSIAEERGEGYLQIYDCGIVIN